MYLTSFLIAVLFLCASSGMGLSVAKALFHHKTSSSSSFSMISSSSRSATEDMTDKYLESDIAFYNRLVTCNNSVIAAQINASLNILNDALRLYGPANVVASYNGGKDADVVMNLMRAAMAKYSLDRKQKISAKFIYFAVKDEFPSVMKHIEYQQKNLGLDIISSPSGILQGISEYMTQPNVGTLAFVLGTRKGDPNCGEQQFFSPSSSWMPPFMRVNPILTWNYGQVWEFLRHFDLKYCDLYDKGYTSLGKQSDTNPNPALKRTGADGQVEYSPACMLTQWSLERAGREKKPSSASIAVADGCEMKDKQASEASGAAE